MHDEKPLRLRIQPSSRAKRKGCNLAALNAIATTHRPKAVPQNGREGTESGCPDRAGAPSLCGKKA
jgi:hypothetical protein